MFESIKQNVWLMAAIIVFSANSTMAQRIGQKPNVDVLTRDSADSDTSHSGVTNSGQVLASQTFTGLWETTYGPMRLRTRGEDIRGAYDYAGGIASIAGQLKDDRLIFRYKEKEAQGSGWFKLSDNGKAISGKWRPDGAQKWQDWQGTRSLPNPRRTWLVILEANWEQGLREPEYAFGDMLTSYFTMATARHVQVRHRFFHDAKDLRRFCDEIQFLPEPVVLLISTHGTKNGITVFGETIKADVLAESLVDANNLKLLHLSGCAMMSGSFANDVHEALGERARFPISGYKTNVAWDASAIGDFTFLSLALIRKMPPEKAARQAIAASPYLGTEKIPGATFKPLGLTVVEPATDD